MCVNHEITRQPGRGYSRSPRDPAVFNLNVETPMKCPTCGGPLGQFGIGIRMNRVFCKRCGTTGIADSVIGGITDIHVPELVTLCRIHMPPNQHFWAGVDVTHIQECLYPPEGRT